MNNVSYQIENNVRLSCDVLVIGSGAGGASAAKVLVDHGFDVLMVEEGPYVPAGQGPSELHESFATQWRNAGITAALGKPTVAYAEGRCVGGGTEINSAIIQQTPESLLEDWARKYKIRDFGPQQLQPYYDDVKRIVNSSLTPPPLGRASELLREAGEKMGWRVTEVERGQRGCVGANMCTHGCPSRGRQSMLNTILPEALGKGMRLISDCRVSRLVVEGGRVTRAVAKAKDGQGKHHTVIIWPKQVFVCAGAIYTPHLLRRSGIKKNVGNTLKMHPTVKVMGVFPEKVDAHLSRFPLYAVTEFMPNMRMGGSLISLSLAGIYCGEDWSTRGWMMDKLENIASYYSMVRSDGSGYVRPVMNFAEPLVTYRLTKRDWHWLTLGSSKLAQALFAAGATHVYPSIQSHSGWHDQASCTEFLDRGLPQSKTRLMSVHLFSSCPMGEDDTWSATDSFGNVHGVANLTLADASQIPEAPGTNPQGTIMALALRNARAYCEKREIAA
ncbi:MAG: FAD-dependent oxidoreductase [Proteobacteria bacterium]|jgi:choline dehydrogenase-like flavoprotein|nr:GMC family oxidoreductase [Alphaproteobacteria bacterium]NCC03316.1 FAD-dependent oxidoreductase [Pseudomonadota bacterium]